LSGYQGNSLAARGGGGNNSGGTNSQTPSSTPPKGQGEYDMEFTIHAGDIDQWEAFPEGFGAKFTTSEEGVIETASNTMGTVYFEGKSPGVSVITGTLDGEERKAKVTVQGKAKIACRYDPPVNFSVEYAETGGDATLAAILGDAITITP
jgi:hypothetical protein